MRCALHVDSHHPVLVGPLRPTLSPWQALSLRPNLNHSHTCPASVGKVPGPPSDQGGDSYVLRWALEQLSPTFRTLRTTGWRPLLCLFQATSIILAGDLRQKQETGRVQINGFVLWKSPNPTATNLIFWGALFYWMTYYFFTFLWLFCLNSLLIKNNFLKHKHSSFLILFVFVHHQSVE